MTRADLELVEAAFARSDRQLQAIAGQCRARTLTVLEMMVLSRHIHDGLRHELAEILVPVRTGPVCLDGRVER